MRQYTVVCEDTLAREIELLSREYGITQEAVVRQLLDVGLEHIR